MTFAKRVAAHNYAAAKKYAAEAKAAEKAANAAYYAHFFDNKVYEADVTKTAYNDAVAAAHFAKAKAKAAAKVYKAAIDTNAAIDAALAAIKAT